MANQTVPTGFAAVPPSGPAMPLTAIASSTLSNSRVEGCVVRQLRGWHFPASESQTIVPSFPFSFAL